MSGAWTPGPWEVVVPPDGIWPPRVFSASTIICMVDNSDMFHDAKVANARLIAAAPDLYAALEACIASLERADTAEGVCCCGDSMDRHSDPMSCGHSPVDMGDYYASKALEAARAALAKARGGA